MTWKSRHDDGRHFITPSKKKLPKIRVRRRLVSERLYDRLKKQWEYFLDDETISVSDLMQESDVGDLYDQLVNDFQTKQKISDNVKEGAFYSEWYDTFADIFYQRLEELGTKIIHEKPDKEDWDYGKSFQFGKYGWEEAKKE